MIPPIILLILGILILGIWTLRHLKNNFSEFLFFKIGMWLFLIQGISSTYGLFIEWGLLPYYAIIMKIASTLFNFLIAYFFYYLMKKAPASMGAGKLINEEEIKKFFEEEESGA